MLFSDLLFDYIQLDTEVANDFVDGVLFDELKVKKDYYEIRTDEESYEYGKPKGKYELVSIPNVIELSRDDLDYCIDEVATSFSSMIGKVTSNDKILIVGLGNRHISSDSLGTSVVKGINITFDNKYLPKVMAICPSVMGLTGIETVDIVEGVVKKIKPTHVILIDSLCASNKVRLGRSIQITNTGICPGGGIGNKRKCIGENIAKNVYSIGVPLLIYSSTFVKNSFENCGVGIDDIDSIMQKLKETSKNSEEIKIMKGIKSILINKYDDMVVSLKDIEECVQILSKIISSAINIALGVNEY